MFYQRNNFGSKSFFSKLICLNIFVWLLLPLGIPKQQVKYHHNYISFVSECLKQTLCPVWPRPPASLEAAAAPCHYWRLQLLSFDYAQINLASQPWRIDISLLDIHQHSAQRCHCSRSNINTQRDQKLSSRNPINQTNCRGGEAVCLGEGRRKVAMMMDQDLCCHCSAVSPLCVPCQSLFIKR